MIPKHRDLHPSIHDALDLSRPTGRRGHRHAGSMSTALSPFHAGMVRFKGGGGVGGIFKSVVVGAVLGAITGGIGFYAMPALGFELAAGATFWGAVAGGAIMGGIGAGLAAPCRSLLEAPQ